MSDTRPQGKADSMGIDELLGARREQVLRLAAKHGARNVRIFGSAARGEGDATSDLRSLMRRFADSTFSVLLTAPLAMLDPVSSLVGKAGIGLVREIWSQRRAKERFGWLFFTYENLRLPSHDVG